MASNLATSITESIALDKSLITTSQPISFHLGNGARILDATLPKCAAAQHELIIVTCFWARSWSQDAIASLLLQLSARALAQDRKIHVRLGFSSCSVAQKLFQTSSLEGKVYPASAWTSLGLPPPGELTGLEMEVKSIFVRPFSVMHPKFIVVDRTLAFMPSCNVSWENWFEGCIEMRGDIAERLFQFWLAFWAQGKSSLPVSLPAEAASGETVDVKNDTPSSSSLIKQTIFPPGLTAPQTILLPSPHHWNPRFGVLATPTCPPTPLNLFLLQAFALAKRTIYVQTPNLTSAPVIAALRAALSRGVDVHLVSSSKLMILEQIVTAGTITELEVCKLRRWHRALLSKHARARESDPEMAVQSPGNLKMGYYSARQGVSGEDEPVKSHLKLTMVDEEVTVLGSGNMDRASWYTSQELGIAFFSAEVATEIRKAVDEALIGRVAYVY